MTTWAEKSATAPTSCCSRLPATDFEIVVGKYLAALAIYTVALLFSLSHVFVLLWLGSPDLGLLFLDLPRLLAGWARLLLALGMVASLLTDNLTVAFILGASSAPLPYSSTTPVSY